jgi:hypothetical protein
MMIGCAKEGSPIFAKDYSYLSATVGLDAVKRQVLIETAHLFAHGGAQAQRIKATKLLGVHTLCMNAWAFRTGS